MEHQMKLLDGPFERIKQGKKILEVRLFDEKRQIIKLDDTIVFLELPDLKQKVTVKVTGLLIYKTFAELIEDLPAVYLGYQENQKDYLKENMYDIYSKEEEQKYGVLGIKVELI